MNILCIDDQRFMLDLLRSLLIERGHSVHAAATPDRAYELLSTERFDLALCDIQMQGQTDGLLLVARIRKEAKLSRVPIIMLTMKDDLGTFQGSLKAGADDYVLKPVRPKRLHTAIERWSGLASVEAPWEDLSREQARLLRLSVGTVGHAFDTARKGAPVSFGNMRRHALAVVRASEDRAVQEILLGLKNHDGRTYAHSLKMGAYLALVCHSLGHQETDIIDMITAGLLHDIGFSRIPLELVKKKTWSEAEVAQIQKDHLKHNEDIIATMEQPPPPKVAAVIRHHHERLDGSGPYGLGADAQPKELRAAVVVNEFLIYRERRRGHLPQRTDAQIIEVMSKDEGLDADLVMSLKELVATPQGNPTDGSGTNRT